MSLLNQGIDFNIGSWHISLVPQAKVAMFAYAVMVLAYLLVFWNMMRFVKSAGAKLLIGIVFIMYVMLIAGISIYNLNCTVVGNCKTFAWVLAGFISVTAIYMIWLACISFFIPRK
jgi:hypothetical protein